jgi:hypothetical protein
MAGRFHLTKRRLIGATLLAAAVIGAWAIDMLAGRSRVLVTISKETTYITEPLRPDGYPDYVAALNALASRGVTPENNAAVPFWRAVGPNPIARQHRAAFFALLGIPPLPEKGDYFVPSGDFLKTLFAEKIAATIRPPKWGGPEDVLEDQCKAAAKRPWSRREFPVWAEWLRVNERPLALIAEASHRPCRYDPSVWLPNQAYHAQTYEYGPQWNTCHALRARAMLKLGGADVAGAWQDLLACHRLARLAGGQAQRMDSATCAADVQLLQHVSLTHRQIVAMQEDLARLRPLPNEAHSFDTVFRLWALDVMIGAAKYGMSTVDDEWPKHIKTPRDVLPRAYDLSRATLDWDHALRTVNEQCDAYVDAFRKPTRSERERALKKLYADRQIRWADLGSWRRLCASPRKAPTELLALSKVFFGSWSGDVEDCAAMSLDLTKLGFALAAYRADRGRYPKTLADLKPKYVSEVPKDIFNDSELHYERTSGGFLLYSVGPNGKDDGGRGVDDRTANEGWDDLSVRVTAKGG